MRTTGGKESPHVSRDLNGLSKIYTSLFPLNRISDSDYISSLLTPSCGQWIMNGSDANNCSHFSMKKLMAFHSLGPSLGVGCGHGLRADFHIQNVSII